MFSRVLAILTVGCLYIGALYAQIPTVVDPNAGPTKVVQPFYTAQPSSFLDADATTSNQKNQQPTTSLVRERERGIATQSVDASYLICPNDLLDVLVFQEPDLTTTTRVSSQGNITLPLIGTIKVGRQSVQKATEAIRNAYKDGYLRDPKVTITVVEFAKKRFNVLGQVQRPGSYEIPQEEKVTLLQAIAMAGGYTRIADSGNITVKRTLDNGKEITLELNAKAMAEDKNAPVFQVQNNDTITVSESIF